MPVPPGVAGAAGAKKLADTVPWSERHRPRHLGEVIGNTDQVRKLAEWLRDWDEVVLRGKVKQVQAPAENANRKFAPAPENINARAALISGPPGIGKTTTCTLVARCNPKYRLMEFNASDARGKAIIEQMSSSLAGNHTLRLGAGAKSAIERAVIIMDECDGMSGGDKGGMQALMSMIKTTKNPIICICNDRNDQGVRNLASICLDIKFKRPENAAVARRIKHVMEGEGKRVELSAIEAIVEACGQDIRHIINQAQFFGFTAPQGRESQKDTQVMLSPFDAAQKLLAGRGKNLPPFSRRLDMFYLDADLMPLMIAENYMKTYEKRRRSDGDPLAECAKAAELIALGDTMSGHWEVQSSAAVIGSLYPAFITADESFQRASFPIHLQKRSAMTKASRLVQDMYSCVRGVTTTSVAGLVTSNYHDVIYKKLLKPLQYGAAKDCAIALFGCGLTKEFFTEQSPALRAPLQLEDAYKKIEGKVKAQLTQELQTLVQAAQAQPVKRKREDGGDGKPKKKGRGPEGDNDAEDNAGGEEASAKKRKSGVKRRENGGANGAGSLNSWRPEKTEDAGEGEGGTAAGGGEKKPLMIMKYLDGHTCAVRRRVHMRDLLEPWVLF